MKYFTLLGILTATFSLGHHAHSDPAAPRSNPLLHKAEFGVGLEGLSDWSRAQMFADAMKTSRAWGGVDKPWEETKNVDANGWPTQDAGVVVMADTPNIDGVYALSFEGRADVAGKFGVRVEDLRFDTATGTSRAQVVVPEKMDQLMLEFTGTQGGVRNVVLMRPKTNANQTFSPAFLEKVKPFAALRFMDYLSTNNNLLKTWNERTTPAMASQAREHGGALEYVVELANLTGKDIWVNVPDQADDNYIRQMANLLKAGLKPEIKVYVEYSNEVWNWQFQQATRNLDAAKIEGKRANSPLAYDKDNNEGYWAMRRIAQKTGEVGQIFREVFGDDNFERVRPIYATQVGYEEVYKQGLNFLENQYGAPNKVIYGIASAPYFQVSDELNKKADLSVDEIFAALPADMEENLGRAAKVQSYATYYGLKHLAYEGGQHLQDHINAGNAEAKIAANRDARMGPMIENYLKGWESMGGDLFMYFTLTSGYSKWGSWGLVEDVAASSPKFEAITKVISDGVVPLTFGTLVPGEIGGGNWTVMSGWDKVGAPSVTVEPGKWVQYDVRVAKAGVYPLALAVRNEANASAEVRVNGTRIIPVAFNANETEGSTSISLQTGLNVIRIVGTRGQLELRNLKIGE